MFLNIGHDDGGRSYIIVPKECINNGCEGQVHSVAYHRQSEKNRQVPTNEGRFYNTLQNIVDSCSVRDGS